MDAGRRRGHRRRLTIPALITLTTDFGPEDSYVAEMKGVMLEINPAVTLVDITHAVRPQQVEQAAFLLASAIPYFPAGTIHLAVVDPGVGTERLPIVLATPAGLFVGPDNGILSGILPEQARPDAGPVPARLPDGSRPTSWRRPTSSAGP